MECMFWMNRSSMKQGSEVLYPFGFEPTLHRYRYGVLDKLKMGQNILVGAILICSGVGT